MKPRLYIPHRAVIVTPNDGSPSFQTYVPVMRQKTYLTPEQQLSRTLDLATLPTEGERGCPLVPERRDEVTNTWVEDPDKLFVGVVQQPTKHFLAGDIVLFRLDNGQAERWRVWGVSSKGHTVRGLYMQFQSWHHEGQYSWRRRKRRVKPRRNHKTPVQHQSGCVGAEPRSFVITKFVKLVDSVERPGELCSLGDLLRRWSADPAAQRVIAEALRAGSSARP